MRAMTRTLVALAVTGTALTVAASTSAASGPTTANDSPSSLVEDFSYPGASTILADRGITLISGDGHLVLVNCTGSTGLIEVHASNSADHSNDPGHYCFRVNGSGGDVKLQLTDAYQVKGDSHAVQATLTVDGQASTVNVAKNGWTGIGVGAGADSATLLELKASS
jgi:hypothetical protein